MHRVNDIGNDKMANYSNYANNDAKRYLGHTRRELFELRRQKIGDKPEFDGILRRALDAQHHNVEKALVQMPAGDRKDVNGLVGAVRFVREIILGGAAAKETAKQTRETAAVIAAAAVVVRLTGRE